MVPFCSYSVMSDKERIAGLERDVKNINDRLDRQDETCVRNVEEIKELINKALSNELQHLKKDIKNITSQLKQNGIHIHASFWDRIKDPSLILNSVISGGVALLVAWVYVTFG